MTCEGMDALERLLEELHEPTPVEPDQAQFRAKPPVRPGARDPRENRPAVPAALPTGLELADTAPPYLKPPARPGVQSLPETVTTAPAFQDGTDLAGPAPVYSKPPPSYNHHVAQHSEQPTREPATSPGPRATSTPRISPWMGVAEMTAAIAVEAAKREREAVRAGEALAFARLRQRHQRRLVQIAERAGAHGNTFEPYVRSAREAWKRAKAEEDAAVQMEAKTLADWDKAAKKLLDATSFYQASVRKYPGFDRCDS